MEYLITYGLALFVILIVLAILVAVVLPQLQAPETCQFTQAGFGCPEHVLVADEDNNVRVLFRLDNQQGEAINLLGVLCTSAPPANVMKDDLVTLQEIDPQNPVSLQMSAGKSITLGSPDSDVKGEIVCLTEDGSNVVLSPGSSFRGSIAITYEFGNLPGAPVRMATATVTGNVQEE